MSALNFQLRLPETELRRLGVRVLTDYRNALGDHNNRISKWREYYRRWAGSVDPQAFGEEAASNLPVPMIRWSVFAKWAKEMDALFGDDAEIVAVPTGPSDYRVVKKIGRYMTWRVFNSMKLVNPFCEFVLRKILFGRSVAYSPWVCDKYEVPLDPEGKQVKEVIDYEGPGFYPLWPDDLIVPAEEVRSIHDFSWVIRKYRCSPDDLLRGEQEGRYQGIKANFDRIVNAAHRLRREFQGDEIKLEKDEAEGIQMMNPLSGQDSLLILEWYGKWRKLKGNQDAEDSDITRREPFQSEIVVKYLVDLNMVIGVQDLMQLYPAKKNRRPFVESTMVKDGSYWPPGLAAMLIDLEDELRANHNLGTEAMEIAAGPVVFYRPASGFNPETFRYEPKTAVPVDNPASDVKIERFVADTQALAVKEQSIIAYSQRLTGLTDLAMGRQEDRPNAPRTARATVALLEEGNVRLSLDTKVLREDMSQVLQHFWDLEWMFAPEQQFFRVTEEDAQGLFPVRDGGAFLTREDRDGRYDFKLEFANSVWSREADKERTLQRYQIDIQNPLIAQNPRALWKVTNDVHAALGDPNFASLVPEPADADLPVNPKEEWNRLLQGEDIRVNPMDNDELHLLRHHEDLQKAAQDPNSDREAVAKLFQHYQEHLQQLQHKKAVQAVIEKAVQNAHQLGMQPGLTAPQMPAFEQPQQTQGEGIQ